MDELVEKIQQVEVGDGSIIILRLKGPLPTMHNPGRPFMGGFRTLAEYIEKRGGKLILVYGDDFDIDVLQVGAAENANMMRRLEENQYSMSDQIDAIYGALQAIARHLRCETSLQEKLKNA